MGKGTKLSEQLGLLVVDERTAVSGVQQKRKKFKGAAQRRGRAFHAPRATPIRPHRSYMAASLGVREMSLHHATRPLRRARIQRGPTSLLPVTELTRTQRPSARKTRDRGGARLSTWYPRVEGDSR